MVSLENAPAGAARFLMRHPILVNDGHTRSRPLRLGAADRLEVEFAQPKLTATPSPRREGTAERGPVGHEPVPVFSRGTTAGRRLVPAVVGTYAKQELP
jgi:hypothetical protein